MKRIIALIMVCLLSVLCFAGCGSDGKGKTFTMGIDPEYPPFSYLDDNGDYTGFDVEVCKAVCEKLGWNFEVFAVNWDQKLVQLDSKECDCVWSGMTILESMKKDYTISAPYFDNNQVLVVKENSSFTKSSDLKDKVVAVQLGTSGESLLQEDLKDLADTFKKVETCESFLKCFTELGGGAVDAVFVDKPVAVAYVSENKGFKIIDENLGAEQYGIAFRADDKEMCKQVEDAIAELVEEGTYKEIADKYEDINNGNLIFLNK